MTVQPPTVEAPLDPDDVEPIHAAILSGYSRPNDIERRISHKWGIRLRDKVYLERPNEQVVQDLIEWAEQQGRARELVGLLWSGKPAGGGNTWVSETSRTRLGGFPSIGVGIFGGGGGSGVGVGAGFPIGGGGDFMRCERNVVVRDGRVIDQTWHGEPDYCDSFRRR